jgi:urease accessory protein
MRAHRILPAGGWDPARETDSVVLEFDLRHRRRITLHTEAGAHLLLDLPQAAHLRDGEGLECEDGTVVRVHARPEPLLEITAGNAADLARLAWHLGNRHLPVQVLHAALRIREDHVIAGMAEALGGSVRPISAPFDPEPGAYAAGGDLAHQHHHHDHDHDH